MKLLLAAVIVLCAHDPLFGATRTWTGGGSKPTWSNPANWGGTAPVVDDDLVFPSGAAFAAVSNDYPAGTEFRSISVGAAFLTLDGNAISLGSGGFKSTASNLVRVKLPISMTASQTWSAGSPVFIEAPLAVNANTVTFDSLLGFLFSADVSGTGRIVMADGSISIIAVTSFRGDVMINGGSISVVQGSLTSPIVQTNGTLAFSSNGTVGDVDIRGGTIEPGNGSGGPNSTIGNSGNVHLVGNYFEVVSSADPSTGFGNLHVTGTVNLGRATLVLIDDSATPLSGGTQLIFIVNDGTDPIVGTFAGLPEGATISVGSRRYRISYVAGTGNDAALTVLGPTTTALSSSANPSFLGQSVTLTATVTGTSGAPTGTVTFFSGATSLGTATVGSAGVATLLASTLTLGSHPISAQYSGDGEFSMSTSNTITQVVNIAPASIPTFSRWALTALVCGLALTGLFVRR